MGEKLLESPIILTVRTMIPRQNLQCSKQHFSNTVTMTSESRYGSIGVLAVLDAVPEGIR